MVVSEKAILKKLTKEIGTDLFVLCAINNWDLDLKRGLIIFNRTLNKSDTLRICENDFIPSPFTLIEKYLLKVHLNKYRDEFLNQSIFELIKKWEIEENMVIGFLN